MKRSSRPDPLAVLRAHEEHIRAAQEAINGLTQFAGYQTAVTLRAMQLATSAQRELEPEEAVRVYDQAAREYFARLASEVDKVASRIAGTLGEHEPVSRELPTFQFFKR